MFELPLKLSNPKPSENKTKTSENKRSGFHRHKRQELVPESTLAPIHLLSGPFSTQFLRNFHHRTAWCERTDPGKNFLKLSLILILGSFPYFRKVLDSVVFRVSQALDAGNIDRIANI